METLKVACPRCGNIDAFTQLKSKLSFASLLGESCTACDHEVSFADVSDMRRRLAQAIGFGSDVIAVSAYSLRHLSAKATGRSRVRLLSGL